MFRRSTDINRSFRNFSLAIFAVWAFGLLLGLGIIGVIIWAIIRFTMHYTG